MEYCILDCGDNVYVNPRSLNVNIKDGKQIFVAIATGDGMKKAGILDKDVLFFSEVSEDEIESGLSASQLRKFTKNYLDGYYAVPKILNKG